MTKVSQSEFDQIMQEAIDMRKKYPNLAIDKIAETVCSNYVHDDETLIFQIVVNLVNLER